MLCNGSFIPETMTIETALAVTIVIAALVASTVTVMLLFARLTSTQRRDVIRLVRQLRRRGKIE